MVDAVKELLQIHVHHNPIARLHVTLCPPDRIMRPTPRTKAIAGIGERRVDQRLQHLQQCLLDEAVNHRGDAKLALASSGLGDHVPAYRLRPIRPVP